MRFVGQSMAMSRYKRMFGFTQVLFLLFAGILMVLGMFGYFNQDLFNIGNWSLVLVFIGGFILILNLAAPVAQMLHIGKFGAWVGAFFLVTVLAMIVAVAAMFYGGVTVFG